MPIFEVEAPDGRIFELEGDSAPTESELEEVFSSMPPVDKPIPVAEGQIIADQQNEGFATPVDIEEVVPPVDEGLTTMKELERMTAGMSEEKKREVVKQLFGGVMNVAFDSMSEELITDVDRSNVEREKELTVLREAREERALGIQERRASGNQTAGDRAKEVIFGREVMEDPEAGLGSMALGLSSVLARGLGALTNKGDIASEETKLLKSYIENVKEWAESDDAQNENLDRLIGDLKATLDKGDLPHKMAIEMQSMIAELEDNKNSDAFNAVATFVSSLILETGSDPLFFAGVGKGTAREIGKLTGKEATEGGVRRSLRSQSKEVEQKGIDRVRSAIGRELDPADEAFLRRGGKRLVEDIKKEGLNVTESGITRLDAKAQQASRRAINVAETETDIAKAGVLDDVNGGVSEAAGRKRLVDKDITARERGISRQERIKREKEGVLEEDISDLETDIAEIEASELSSVQKDIAILKAEERAKKGKFEDVLEDTPAKQTLKESADIDPKVLERKFEDFRKSVAEGDTGIKAFTALDNVRSSVSLTKSQKSEVIGDVISSMSGKTGLSKDIVESIVEGKSFRSAVTGGRKRVGRQLTTTDEIVEALREGGVTTNTLKVAQVIERVLKGNLSEADKVMKTFGDLFVAGVKPTAKQKAKEVSGNASIIMGKIREFSDEALKGSLSSEKYNQFKRVREKAGVKLGAQKKGRKFAGITSVEDKKFAEFGGVTDPIENMGKAVDKEAKKLLESGLDDTIAMTEGKFKQFKDVKKRDFNPHIRKKAAKLAEEKIKKLISSKAKNISKEDLVLAGKADKILNTNLEKKLKNVQERSASQSKVQEISRSSGVKSEKIKQAGLERTEKAASSVKLKREDIKSLSEKARKDFTEMDALISESGKDLKDVKKVSDKFQKEIDTINKSIESKLKNASTKDLDALKPILSTNVDAFENAVERTSKILKKIEDTAAEIATQGSLSSDRLDQLKNIDRILNTRLAKIAVLKGQRDRFNVGPKGKPGFLKTDQSSIPFVSSILVSPIGRGAAIANAGVQAGKSIATVIDKKRIFKALKLMEKTMDKKTALRASHLRQVKDIKSGKALLAAEIGKGNVWKTLDLLTSRGLVTMRQLAESFGKENFDNMIVLSKHQTAKNKSDVENKRIIERQGEQASEAVYP